MRLTLEILQNYRIRESTVRITLQEEQKQEFITLLDKDNSLSSYWKEELTNYCNNEKIEKFEEACYHREDRIVKKDRFCTFRIPIRLFTIVDKDNLFKDVVKFDILGNQISIKLFENEKLGREKLIDVFNTREDSKKANILNSEIKKLRKKYYELLV